METIFALSSGAPPAAIAVMRISGPAALRVGEALTGSLPPPRRAMVRTVRDPQDRTVLDRALVLVFPAGESVTGEDLVELHLHGGRALVRAVEAVLARQEGVRLAEPGEFTRRALTHGRIDLTEAEGLGDLLMAETEDQRRLAMRAAGGAVRREVEGWAARLLGMAAQVEAQLDHADEGDVGDTAEDLATLHAEAGGLASDMEAVLARPPVERLRDGLRVVLAGPPNAGKSTLFNRLAEREAAIVSPIAGTTRDRIEAPVVRNGRAYLLVDTAGLAEATDDPIETVGIDRARDAIEQADILLWLGDDPPPEHPVRMWLRARADLGSESHGPLRDLSVSAHTGEGLDMLWQRLDALATTLLPPPDLIGFNHRQRELAGHAANALRRAQGEADLILFAEELRAARVALDAIIGKAGVEAMLDAMFARFCIGK